MDQLIHSLPALLQAAGDTAEIRETATIVAWNHVAGEALRQQTAPIALQQQRLLIAVSDAIWKRQLEGMGAQLLFRLSSLLGRDVVTFIEFRVEPNAVQAANKKRAATRNVQAAPASDMAIPFELLTAATAISDSKLRRAFLGAAMSCARRMENG